MDCKKSKSRNHKSARFKIVSANSLEIFQTQIFVATGISHTIMILFISLFLLLHMKNCLRPTDSEKTISFFIVRQREIYSKIPENHRQNPKITKLIISEDDHAQPTAAPKRSPRTFSEVTTRGGTKSGGNRA